MPTPNTIAQEVIASLDEFKDEKRIAFAQSSYPTSMKILGVTNPNAKLVLKELRTLTKQNSGREKIAIAKELAKTNIFECQHMAFEYLGKDKAALQELNEQDIDEFQYNLDNWVSVDCFGAYLVGYAWRTGKIDTNKIKSYFKSDDFWIRRIALVATVALNQKARGGTGDAERTLEICSLAINDHTDLINKALSWALRELAKVDKESVQKFIKEHEASLHSRVLKEVRNKLETGRKYS